MSNFSRHGKSHDARIAASEPQLRKRHAVLSLPPLRRAHDPDVPYRVPAPIAVGIVEPVRIDLDAGRVDAELIGRAIVVKGIDEDGNPIGRR